MEVLGFKPENGGIFFPVQKAESRKGREDHNSKKVIERGHASFYLSVAVMEHFINCWWGLDVLQMMANCKVESDHFSRPDLEEQSCCFKKALCCLVRRERGTVGRPEINACQEQAKQ